MPTCCVPGCGMSTGNNMYRRAIKSGVKISMHRIPKDKKILKQFVKLVKQETGRYFQISCFTSICSLHYKPEDFHMFGSGRRDLKPGTLPSIFDAKSVEKQNEDEQNRRTLSLEEPGHSSSTETADTDHDDYEESCNEAKSCATRDEFTYAEAHCNIEVDPLDISGLKSEQDDLNFGQEVTSGVIPVTFTYEETPIKLEMDPLDISATESGDESSEQEEATNSTVTGKNLIFLKYTIPKLRSEVERLCTLNTALTEEQQKLANSNRDFENKFVKISRELQQAKAELQRAKSKTQRYVAERAKLRAELQIPDTQPGNNRNTNSNLGKNVIIYKIKLPNIK